MGWFLHPTMGILAWAPCHKARHWASSPCSTAWKMSIQAPSSPAL